MSSNCDFSHFLKSQDIFLSHCFDFLCHDSHSFTETLSQYTRREKSYSNIYTERRESFQMGKLSYLKSGSARRDAYFNVSLHGIRDLIFNSSRTYCSTIRWKIKLSIKKKPETKKERKMSTDLCYNEKIDIPSSSWQWIKVQAT